MSVQPLSASRDTNDGSVAPSNVSYVEGFDDPSANVVLLGSDKVALRVHDYWLKAASPFFRDILEAGTKGGPVPLEASSGQLEAIMEKVMTGKFTRSTLYHLAETEDESAIDNGYDDLSSLIKLHHISQKYLFEDVSLAIRGIIVHFAAQHPPMALVFACGCDLTNAAISRTAIKAFALPMEEHVIGHYYRKLYCHYPDVDHDEDVFEIEYATPFVENISQPFARELGVDALLAFTRASQEVFNHSPLSPRYREYNKEKDWSKVAEMFLREMGIQHQNELSLMIEDQRRSAWSPTGDLVKEAGVKTV